MGMGQTTFAGRLGQYVRDKHVPHQAPAEMPFPLSQEMRDAINHHLIPLALLACADGYVAAAERQAIVHHALILLEKIGYPVTTDELHKLMDYVSYLNPSLMQLDPALHRLEREDADSKIAFLGAVRAVAMADGRIDPAEARLLDELKLEFAKA